MRRNAAYKECRSREAARLLRLYSKAGAGQGGKLYAAIQQDDNTPEGFGQVPARLPKKKWPLSLAPSSSSPLPSVSLVIRMRGLVFIPPGEPVAPVAGPPFWMP